MIKHIVLIMICLASYLTQGQIFNKIVFDEDAQQEILYGVCTIDGFMIDQFEPWYSLEFDEYIPNEQDVENISGLLECVSIRIVFGSWCSDSQREVPRFLKIVSSIAIPFERLEIIGVNRKKMAVEAGIIEGYVDFVPTFIIFLNGKEIGRIIETPNQTLERDFLEILSSSTHQ
jgi:thiol-disulfide isomerase/thioredoxin